jgi:imidazolonepropionase
MTPADFLVRNIGRLATLAGPTPRVGAACRDVGLVVGAAVAGFQGRIVYSGPEEGLDLAVTPADDVLVLDAEGAAVVPGFVDAHTHLAFAGDRDEEIRQRLAGISYKEIAAAGGGIVRSVTATRRATKEDLVHRILGRLDEMLLCGTTTAEIKSGYGLETAAEIRSLEAIRAASELHPVTVVPTFLGAHEVPVEHRNDRQHYVDILVQEMIPEVARRRLAVFCDVFCEEGVFTIAESRRILETARKQGMKLRLHADELAWTGGAELAAELRCRSADHLIFASALGIKAMAEAGVAATLLPAAAFYLRLPRFAPARAMLDAGVPLALATDVNPSGGLSPSLPFAMTVGCFGMGLALEEALTAATIGGAYSIEVDDKAGSLELGKWADLVILRSSRLLDLVRVGAPAIRSVVKRGRIVVSDGRRV